MADPAVFTLCETIVEDLNATTFDLPFRAAFEIVPRMEMKDLATVKVTVIPAAEPIEPTPDDRGRWGIEHQVDIGIHFKLKTDDPKEMIPYYRLTEQIADHYRFVRPTGEDTPLIGVRYLPYSPELLEKKQYMGIVKLTFQEWRE